MPSVWFELDDGKQFLRQAVALARGSRSSACRSRAESAEARSAHVRAFEQALRTLRPLTPEELGSALAPPDQVVMQLVGDGGVPADAAAPTDAARGDGDVRASASYEDRIRSARARNSELNEPSVPADVAARRSRRATRPPRRRTSVPAAVRGSSRRRHRRGRASTYARQRCGRVLAAAATAATVATICAASVSRSASSSSGPISTQPNWRSSSGQ